VGAPKGEVREEGTRREMPARAGRLAPAEEGKRIK
jgi:hypothetical protein